MKFAKYSDVFVKRREELQLAMSTYITLRVHLANLGLDVRMERTEDLAGELEESLRKKAMEKEMEVKELKDQKNGAEEEANHLRKNITEMQREEEWMRQEMRKVEKRCQELEEQKGRAQEDTDDLGKHIAEIQSNSGEGKHHRSGESSDTYDCSSCSPLLHSRAFLAAPAARSPG